jgi:hypothetical protein
MNLFNYNYTCKTYNCYNKESINGNINIENVKYNIEKVDYHNLKVTKSNNAEMAAVRSLVKWTGNLNSFTYHKLTRGAEVCSIKSTYAYLTRDFNPSNKHRNHTLPLRKPHYLLFPYSPKKMFNNFMNNGF